MFVSKWFACALPAVLLAAYVPAQVRDPVPVRLAVAEYGQHDRFSPTLKLGCNVRSPVASEIRLSGGVWGDPACVLFDTQHAWLPWKWGVFAVSPNAVPLAGVFDKNGELCLPVNLARTDFVGLTFYMQGVCVTQPVVDVVFTRGFEMTFVPGNVQPALNYEGPPVTALLCKVGDPFAPPIYDLLLRFAVQFPGYRVELSEVVAGDQVTKVYVNLLPPGPELDLVKWPHDVRLVVDLGKEVAKEVELWVNPGQYFGIRRPFPYQLAAVIDSKF